MGDAVKRCARCQKVLTRSEVERGWTLCNDCRADDRRREKR